MQVTGGQLLPSPFPSRNDRHQKQSMSSNTSDFLDASDSSSYDEPTGTERLGADMILQTIASANRAVATGDFNQPAQQPPAQVQGQFAKRESKVSRPYIAEKMQSRGHIMLVDHAQQKGSQPQPVRTKKRSRRASSRDKKLKGKRLKGSQISLHFQGPEQHTQNMGSHLVSLKASLFDHLPRTRSNEDTGMQDLAESTHSAKRDLQLDSISRQLKDKILSSVKRGTRASIVSLLSPSQVSQFKECKSFRSRKTKLKNGKDYTQINMLFCSEIDSLTRRNSVQSLRKAKAKACKARKKKQSYACHTQSFDEDNPEKDGPVPSKSNLGGKSRDVLSDHSNVRSDLRKPASQVNAERRSNLRQTTEKRRPKKTIAASLSEQMLWSPQFSPSPESRFPSIFPKTNASISSEAPSSLKNCSFQEKTSLHSMQLIKQQKKAMKKLEQIEKTIQETKNPTCSVPLGIQAALFLPRQKELTAKKSQASVLSGTSMPQIHEGVGSVDGGAEQVVQEMSFIEHKHQMQASIERCKRIGRQQLKKDSSMTDQPMESLKHVKTEARLDTIQPRATEEVSRAHRNATIKFLPKQSHLLDPKPVVSKKKKSEKPSSLLSPPPKEKQARLALKHRKQSKAILPKKSPDGHAEELPVIRSPTNFKARTAESKVEQQNLSRKGTQSSIQGPQRIQPQEQKDLRPKAASKIKLLSPKAQHHSLAGIATHQEIKPVRFLQKRQSQTNQSLTDTGSLKQTSHLQIHSQNALFSVKKGTKLQTQNEQLAKVLSPMLLHLKAKQVTAQTQSRFLNTVTTYNSQADSQSLQRKKSSQEDLSDRTVLTKNKKKQLLQQLKDMQELRGQEPQVPPAVETRKIDMRSVPDWLSPKRNGRQLKFKKKLKNKTPRAAGLNDISPESESKQFATGQLRNLDEPGSHHRSSRSISHLHQHKQPTDSSLKDLNKTQESGEPRIDLGSSKKRVSSSRHRSKHSQLSARGHSSSNRNIRHRVLSGAGLALQADPDSSEGNTNRFKTAVVSKLFSEQIQAPLSQDQKIELIKLTYGTNSANPLFTAQVKESGVTPTKKSSPRKAIISAKKQKPGTYRPQVQPTGEPSQALYDNLVKLTKQVTDQNAIQFLQQQLSPLRQPPMSASNGAAILGSPTKLLSLLSSSKSESNLKSPKEGEQDNRPGIDDFMAYLEREARQASNSIQPSLVPAPISPTQESALERISRIYAPKPLILSGDTLSRQHSRLQTPLKSTTPSQQADPANSGFLKQRQAEPKRLEKRLILKAKQDGAALQKGRLKNNFVIRESVEKKQRSVLAMHHAMKNSQNPPSTMNEQEKTNMGSFENGQPAPAHSSLMTFYNTNVFISGDSQQKQAAPVSLRRDVVSSAEHSFDSDLDESPRNFVKVFEVECFYEQQQTKTAVAKNKIVAGGKQGKRGFLRHRSRKLVKILPAGM